MISPHESRGVWVLSPTNDRSLNTDAEGSGLLISMNANADKVRRLVADTHIILGMRTWTERGCFIALACGGKVRGVLKRRNGGLWAGKPKNCYRIYLASFLRK